MAILKSSDFFEMDLTSEEASIIDELIPVQFFSKGTILLREDEIASRAFYVLEGLARAYIVKPDGEVRTTRFFVEKEPCVNLDSYVTQVPSKYFLECMEDCLLSVVTHENERKLAEQFPIYQELCKVSIEKEFGKTQNEMAAFISSRPEERYLDLIENRPDLIQRVPQYHLASYLGITPESLSRMRNRIAKR